MKLSVVTITFNNLAGLKRTLAVFEKERFVHEVEIVVVDGGSKDGTEAFLASQTLTANWVSEPDRGIYHAMNKGLARATGEYVWFLNAGDWVEDPETIRTLLNVLDKHPDAVYGETMMVTPDGKELGTRSTVTTRKLPESLNWKSLRFGMCVGHQSFVVRKSLAPQYDETLKHVADIDWMIRCLKNCRQVINLNRVLSNFAVEGHSTHNRKQSNLERFRVLRKHYGLIPNLLAHALIVVRKMLSPRRL